MQEQMERGPGGKLALWVFYAFCGYFVWAMARYLWVISDVQSIPGATIDGEIGSSMGKWIGALLGGIAWYTRPRRLEQEEQR
ncbi:cell division protein DrpB [Kluyvera sichuanensis]|uniref:cell division protein DrpB n=1 Tax=Kluyvera sichuanensis TaxID=2725494 RepID=UPI00397C8990